MVALVVAVAAYLTWLAARVDRLHGRASAAGQALDAHLLRRAAAAAVLAEELLLPELYAAARAALDAGPDEREAAENDLTRQLRALPLTADDPALAPVVAASRRVALARQVHTDLVRDARSLRGRPLVRLLGWPAGTRCPRTSTWTTPRSTAAARRKRSREACSQASPPGDRLAVGVPQPCRPRTQSSDRASADTTSVTGTARVKRGMAEMLKGGVIMDVVTPEQAKIAEDAGAVAVMALERVPADIRAQGGVARMTDPEMIDGIIDAVSIPVMAKARIGHFVEAQVLQAIGVDYVDESEVLTPADEAHHIDKWAFTVPFVCGATNLGEALRRISRGRRDDPVQGRGGHRQRVRGDPPHAPDPRRDPPADHPDAEDELYAAAKELRAPYELVGRGGRDGQAAGRAVHRGRHRHPGRRGDDDAARRRGRLRRLGHLQVR